MNVGCDIVMISRVKDALAHTPGFPNFLSEHERAQFEALKGQRQAEWLAGRFAAKEAIVKAMHGVRELHICDIEIRSDDSGAPVYVSASDGKITFTTDHNEAGGWAGCKWGKVKTECKSEMLKEYALFAGEEKAYCYIDATEGEYIPFRGGYWYDGAYAGVFYLGLSDSRAVSGWGIGGRSAFFKKLKAEH